MLIKHFQQPVTINNHDTDIVSKLSQQINNYDIKLSEDRKNK